MSQKETSKFMPLFSISSSPLPPDFFAPGAQIEKLCYATYSIYSSLGLDRGPVDVYSRQFDGAGFIK